LWWAFPLRIPFGRQWFNGSMVQWFKAHYPNTPVAALQFYEWEKFPGADVATLSEDPAIWLAEIASILKS
jgi:hypothetical protein